MAVSYDFRDAQPKKKAAPDAATITINELKAVSELAKQFGGLEKLRRAIDEAEEFENGAAVPNTVPK